MLQQLLQPLIVGLLVTMTTLPTASQASETEALLGTIFSEIEKRTIEEYYRGRFGKTESTQKKRGKKSKKQKGLPPGLAKRDTLPPGLTKQLEKNGRLPPGLEKRDLPEGLSGLLPRRPSGQERVVVDNDVLLIETATGLILDILTDIF